MQLNHTILREIGMLSRAIKTKNDVMFSPLDLHKNQYVFLTRICEHRGISPKELSIILRIDKTTTTKAVQKLIQNGYVVKQKNDEDGRKINLFPTSKALKVYNDLISEENQILKICFKDFSDEDINNIHKLIKRMNENYKESWYQAQNYKGDRL